MRDDGAFCAKKSYGRGVGAVLNCCGNKEKDAGLCYPRCKSGYKGVGPVCWKKDPFGGLLQVSSGASAIPASNDNWKELSETQHKISAESLLATPAFKKYTEWDPNS